jgi:hypothetical protein
LWANIQTLDVGSIMGSSQTDDDDNEFRRRMANSVQVRKLLDEASQRVSQTGGIPHDEFWNQIDSKYEKKSNGRRPKKA